MIPRLSPFRPNALTLLSILGFVTAQAVIAQQVQVDKPDYLQASANGVAYQLTGKENFLRPKAAWPSALTRPLVGKSTETAKSGTAIVSNQEWAHSGNEVSAPRASPRFGRTEALPSMPIGGFDRQQRMQDAVRNANRQLQQDYEATAAGIGAGVDRGVQRASHPLGW